MIRHVRQLLLMIGTAALAVSTAAAEITVGGKNFTEQLLMAEMTEQLLEANGYDVNKRDGMGSTVLRKAQLNGQIDVYWEYTGTSLVTYNKMDPEGLSARETIEKVRATDREKGLVWLQCSDANNTYALAVREGDDATGDLQTLSDLARHYRQGEDVSLGVNSEFPHREDGLIGLEETYDFDVPRAQQKPMETGLIYNALREGEVDVGLVFATDGRIAAFDFRVLKDDKGFFPNYALCPVAREEVLEAKPELRDILNELSAKLDDETMQSLNKQVDVDERSIENVARSFLNKQGLI